jgi:molybdate transport system permease protein
LSETQSAQPVGGFRSRLFAASMFLFVGLFTVCWVALLAADCSYTNTQAFLEVLTKPETLAALSLSLWTSGVSVVIGLLFAVPMGYALSRYRFPGHALVDSIVDLPILLPPLIVGLSLLVFFRTGVGQFIEGTGLRFVFQRRGIVLCQFLVSASFGIRAMKICFDGIDVRLEHVAMTLGCTRFGAFWRVAFPLARRGMVAGAILIWTRAFGLFAPLMIFVGAVRRKTEVLPTMIYLEQSVGRLEVALAVALLMVALATVALVGVRLLVLREP